MKSMTVSMHRDPVHAAEEVVGVDPHLLRVLAGGLVELLAEEAGDELVVRGVEQQQGAGGDAGDVVERVDPLGDLRDVSGDHSKSIMPSTLAPPTIDAIARMRGSWATNVRPVIAPRLMPA